MLKWRPFRSTLTFARKLVLALASVQFPEFQTRLKRYAHGHGHGAVKLKVSEVRFPIAY